MSIYTSTFVLPKGNCAIPLVNEAKMHERWLKSRYEKIVPAMMKETGIDMWIVMARELNDDPVMKALIPYDNENLTRLTVLIMYLNENDELEKYSLVREGNDKYALYYKPIWKDKEETQWERLRRLVDEKNPKVIGLDYSDNLALCDGITYTLYNSTVKALGDENSKKIVSAENLVRRVMETRLPEELAAYDEVNHIVHEIIDKLYTNDVIRPGITTAEEATWTLKEIIRSVVGANKSACFVNIQRKGVAEVLEGNTVIMPGDLLNCDVVYEYMGLWTDIGRCAYVLRPDETDVPESIKGAMRLCNKFQDLSVDKFVLGSTGNEIFLASLEAAKENNILVRHYTHPIGLNDHGAGPTIGLWNKQSFIEDIGEYKLYNNTCYALELDIKKEIPEWDNQLLKIRLEEILVISEGEKYFSAGRQTELYLIRG